MTMTQTRAQTPPTFPGAFSGAFPGADTALLDPAEVYTLPPLFPGLRLGDRVVTRYKGYPYEGVIVEVRKDGARVFHDNNMLGGWMTDELRVTARLSPPDLIDFAVGDLVEYTRKDGTRPLGRIVNLSTMERDLKPLRQHNPDAVCAVRLALEPDWVTHVGHPVTIDVRRLTRVGERAPA
jgi:hypothetical protein